MPPRCGRALHGRRCRLHCEAYYANAKFHKGRMTTSKLIARQHTDNSLFLLILATWSQGIENESHIFVQRTEAKGVLSDFLPGTKKKIGMDKKRGREPSYPSHLFLPRAHLWILLQAKRMGKGRHGKTLIPAKASMEEKQNNISSWAPAGFAWRSAAVARPEKNNSVPSFVL